MSRKSWPAPSGTPAGTTPSPRVRRGTVPCGQVRYSSVRTYTSSRRRRASSRLRLIGRAPHPLIELQVLKHDGHTIVILRHARRASVVTMAKLARRA
jgi:hypothetical protein